MSEPYDVYVELDALQDSRWGLLMQLAPERAKLLLKDLRYYQRENDDFEAMVGLPRDITDAAYAARSVETLKGSLLTGMMFKLRDIVRDLFQESLTNPSMNRIKIDLNVWPYVLTQDEHDALAEAVTHHIGVEVPINVVSMRPEEITPRHIRNTYSGMIMYNFNTWLLANEKALRSVLFPRVTILTPLIYVRDIPPPDVVNIPDAPHLNPFTLAMIGFKPYFNLTFVPVVNYCVIPPRILRDKLSENPKVP